MNLEKFKSFLMKKENIFILVLIMVVVFVSAGYLYVNKKDQIIVEKRNNAGKELDNASLTKSVNAVNEDVNSQSKQKDSDIRVYVVGAVNNPGVVNLKKGQIIDDAVKGAGGFTKDADVENINLVYKLNENSMLKIFKKNERTVVNDGEVGGKSFQTGNTNTNNHEGNKESSNDNNISSNHLEVPLGFEVISDSQGVVKTQDACGQSAKNDNGTSGGKVKLNSASKDDLMKLPGIGKSLAERIIDYRTKNGKFKTNEDVKNVSGIGDSKFNAIKDSISVD